MTEANTSDIVNNIFPSKKEEIYRNINQIKLFKLIVYLFC